MAATSILNANPLLLSNQRQNFNENLNQLRFIKSSKFRTTTPNFINLQLNCFFNESYSSTSKNKIIEVPFEASETKFQSTNSIEKLPHHALLLFNTCTTRTISRIFKWLKIPSIVFAMSLFSMTMVYSRDSAWASSSDSSSSDSSTDSSSSSDSDSDSYRYSRSRSSDSYRSWEDMDDPTPLTLTSVFIVIFLVAPVISLFFTGSGVKIRRTTVVKLQVGLWVTEPSLQRDLNRIAETTETSTRSGRSSTLNKTIETLLKHDDCWVSGYSSVDVKTNKQDAKQYFKELSVEERAKFDEDTLVDSKNIKKKTMITNYQEPDQFTSTHLVVTILVRTKVSYPLPPITNREDLKKALDWWSSRNSDDLKALHVLWTPQKENETMSREQLNKSYPLLNPFDT